jgi:NAD(P)-dependent dehydrogenase (short-subunit alcohol dehydrogenase family)
MKATGKIVSLCAVGISAAVALGRLRKREAIDFKGRSVIITGGSRGLGLILARQLAAEGARLTLLARDAAELQRAEQDVTRYGGEVFTAVCDVRDRDDVEQAIQQVIDRYGHIDVLINNAGMIQVGPLEHMSLDDFEDAMAVHMWGPLYTMLAVAPHMRRQGGGRIVNISSIGGKVAVPHLVPYSTSKFALVGLSDGMRAELAKDHIYVTTVCPGLMRTGSPPNVAIKGQHRSEYAWFAISDALPLVSIDAERAARQIIDACRHGDPELTITLQARLLSIANYVFPGLVGNTMALVNRLLPGPTGAEGDQAKTGWESQSALAPSVLTRLSDQATAQNNEMNGHQRMVSGGRSRGIGGW